MSRRQQQRSLPLHSDRAAVPDDAVPDDAVPDDAVPDDEDRSMMNVPPHTDDPAPIHGCSVYVIDAHSLIFQVFHALPEMTSPHGEPVAAAYGFTRDVLQLLETGNPDYLFCAFDYPGTTFRHEFYEPYKADREAMPDALSVQLPKIRTLLEALAVPVLECQGFEADDVLATMARLCDQQLASCYLVTSDKDCRQLITDRVSLFNLRKNEVFNAESLRREWNIRPDQVVDFQALVGDPVDNIPGVPLIGPKIASQLLQTYGTLDSVLRHAAEIKGAKRSKNLQDSRDQALVSQKLARLSDDVPLHVDWDAGRVGDFQVARLVELFGELGFHSFMDRLRKLGADQPAPQWRATYEVVDTDAKLDALVERLASQRRLSIDTETTHLSPRWARLVGISLAWREAEAYYLPVAGPPGDACLDEQKTLDRLRPILEDPAVEKVGQNLKYDAVVLRNAGVRLAGMQFDTMVASYLLDAGERNHNLDQLSERYLNHRPIAITELIGRGKQQKRMDEVPVARVGPYAAEDADIPLRLYPMLEHRLETADMAPLFRDVEMPLVDVLANMEYDGVCVDTERLGDLSAQFGARLDTLEAEIYALAGRKLNIASTRQLADVLFGELQLPVLKRTKSGPSTDADVLQQLAALHELPQRILQFRQFAKLKNTYVDALPKLVHPETGRLHASFHQVVAATGRLSSSDPNLQNIPVRTDAGRQIRSAFVTRDAGWRLVAADYSQIELRVLAHFSFDDELCRAFHAGEDIHTRVAAEVFGVPIDDVTPAMRRRAKAVNFGIVYGQSAFGLAKSLGIEREQAAAFIESYFARYPGVEAFLYSTLDACRHDGHVKTLLGRKRSIRGVRDSIKGGLNLAERTAVNTVIQGSAADLIKLAMLAIYRGIRQRGWRAAMVLQIHDELIFEVPREEIDELTRLVRREMAGVVPLRVPLSVDIKSGANWAECEPMEEEDKQDK